MTWRFGTVVGMDYSPEMRLLILCLTTESTKWRRIGREPGWSALVLQDEVWPVGLIVTVAPDNAGVRVLDQAKEGA